MLLCIAFISHELIIQTHRLNFVLEPVPHNNITIPTTSCQQVIIRVKGHTVQRTRTEERHYLLTFNRRPHLKKYAKTPLWHVNIEWNIGGKNPIMKRNESVFCARPTFSVESRDTVARYFPSAVRPFAVIAFVCPSIIYVLQRDTTGSFHTVTQRIQPCEWWYCSPHLTCSHSQDPRSLYVHQRRW